MGELILQLLPELAGMAVTPAAIAGCVLLLQTKRALANAFAFFAAFMIAYTAIGVTALLTGATHDARSGTASHWAGLVVGLVFIAFGVGQAVRTRVPSDTGPEWMQQLSNAKPRGAFVMGAALSVLNPNLAIMVSGMTVIAASDTSAGASMFGTVLLLLAAALDFIVPIGAFLILGERAKEGLAVVKSWMLEHERPLSLTVFFGFGALFVIRNVVALV
ncbi:GAP family protein [Prescottella agglutinans]|uniref:Threonine/homoserine/homoserine lactone efflux protein n=1 Tax=Prescottella agglutinans TaxID=1644129 RepID=A0ABT6MDN4_9NOCA|nr:GAP family protein [Prescottella agglutinans]MDH6282417.1 threonine/homoserine/homoserine lactone efflux protein [Prescottella agglutinans]